MLLFRLESAKIAYFGHRLLYDTVINPKFDENMDWLEENSYLENDFAVAAKKGAIKQINIIQAEEGYYIALHVSWSKEPLFLATRRDRKNPRYFKDVDRLLEKLRLHVVNVPTITLHVSESPPKKRIIRRKIVVRKAKSTIKTKQVDNKSQ